MCGRASRWWDVPLAGLCRIATPHIAGYSLDGKLRGTAQIYQAFCAWMQLPASIGVAQLLPAPIAASFSCVLSATESSNVRAKDRITHVEINAADQIHLVFLLRQIPRAAELDAPRSRQQTPEEPLASGQYKSVSMVRQRSRADGRAFCTRICNGTKSLSRVRTARIFGIFVDSAFRHGNGERHCLLVAAPLPHGTGILASMAGIQRNRHRRSSPCCDQDVHVPFW